MKKMKKESGVIKEFQGKIITGNKQTGSEDIKSTYVTTNKSSNKKMKK